jgi:uncharacterized protein with NRDE domain
MCLIALSWQQHPQYKLILVANRDEFYRRKTLQAHYWSDNPSILAGKDLEAGGTWMGVCQNGKFTALTNYRDIQNLNPQAISRGNLTAQYLQSDLAPFEYLKGIAMESKQYNGFNLLVGDERNLYYYSNYEGQVRQLKAGVYGLSNHLLDTAWYKVKKLKMKFKEYLQENQVQVSELLDLMHDTEKPADSEVQQTGLDMERERMLSPMFIESAEYGTCSSTVLLIDYDNRVQFTERVYETAYRAASEQTFRFEIGI